MIKIEKDKKLQFQLQNLTFTTTPNRINEMKWEGAVCKIGVPSDGVPGGAWTQIVLERSAIEEASQTIVNMPLNCYWPDEWWNNPAMALTGHDQNFCIGVVQKAWIDGDYLMCSGIIWRDNFWDVSFMIQNAYQSLGFSIECYPLDSKTEEDSYEHIYKLEFTGLCICFSNLAAFEDTFITQLIATKNKNVKKVDDKMPMTKEELQAMMLEFTKGITEEITKVKASVDEKFAALDKEKADEEAQKIEAAKQAEAEAKAKLETENAELKAKLEAASKGIPAPTAGQSAAPKDGEINFEAEREEINKMKCSIEEKMKLRSQLALKAQVQKQAQ